MQLYLHVELMASPLTVDPGHNLCRFDLLTYIWCHVPWYLSHLHWPHAWGFPERERERGRELHGFPKRPKLLGGDVVFCFCVKVMLLAFYIHGDMRCSVTSLVHGQQLYRTRALVFWVIVFSKMPEFCQLLILLRIFKNLINYPLVTMQGMDWK